MGTFDINSLITALIYIVPLGTLGISVMMFNNAAKERHEKNATEAADIKSDLRVLSEQVSDLRDSISDAQNGYHSNDKRITTLEQRCRSLEKRVEIIEKELRNG